MQLLNPTIVMRKTLRRVFTRPVNPLLTTQVEYPQLVAERTPLVFQSINDHYAKMANDFMAYGYTKLQRQALMDYEASRRNNYPFHAHEALKDFTVHYDINCTFSLSFDTYTYTGGAHGSTLRSADTWNLLNGRRYALKDFFPAGYDYRKYIIDEVRAQMLIQLEEDDSLYFSVETAAIDAAYNEKDFYLVPDGIIVFFQQYAIAPYAVGIPEFLIPFSSSPAVEPMCKR